MNDKFSYYSVPSDLGSNFPYSVIKYDGKLYSFGITAHSFKALEREVTERINELVFVDPKDIDFDIEQFRVYVDEENNEVYPK